MIKETKMKKIQMVLLVFLCAGSVVGAQEKPDPEELLADVDDNEVYETIQYTGTMIIEHRGKRFKKTFTAYGRENNDTYIEFTNSEDRGTKYLKKDGRLYVYSPDTEQVMLISGHMLKESMMGSDLSYEDTIDNEPLAKRYTAEIQGSEKIRGRDAYVLMLEAKKKTESYPKRKFWVAQDTHELLRSEMFALSGSKLKVYNLIKSRKIQGKYFPVEMEMKDLLRKDSRTVFKMSDVELDISIPDSVFSMRNLER